MEVSHTLVYRHGETPSWGTVHTTCFGWNRRVIAMSGKDGLLTGTLRRNQLIGESQGKRKKGTLMMTRNYTGTSERGVIDSMDL